MVGNERGASEHRRRLDRLFAGGLAWSAGAKSVTQLLSWASVLIAARLLSPSDFGLTAMAGAFAGMTNVLAEFGIGSAVLQMQELEREVLAQIHTFACFLCVGIFLAGEAASPLIAGFFKSERLLPVLLVNNVVFFITGFQQVPMALLQRDMDYRRLSLSEAAVACVQSIATIAAAFAGWRYWSLVAGVVAGRVTGAALGYYWQPIPFRMPRWKQIGSPVRMGAQIAIARLAWSAYTQSDGVVVGRRLGESLLGTYQMAMMLASAPAEKICMLIMRAAGPLFAKIQKDRELVRRYFLIITEAIGLLVLPLMLGLAVVAPDAIAALLGRKWVGAAAPLMWLALFVAVRSMAVLSDQVLVPLRQTRFTMGMALLNLAVMPAAFWFASRWGLDAVSASWLILSPITVLPVIVKLMRSAQITFREIILSLTPALTGACAMLAAVALVRQWPGGNAYTRLLTQAGAGAAAYALVLMVPFRDRVLRYFRFLYSLRQASGA